MKQTRIALIGIVTLTAACLALQTAIRAETRTYTYEENGQTFRITETSSTLKDRHGRPGNYESTEERRDLNGKLVKVVKTTKSYSYDQNGHWDYVTTSESTTQSNADGGHTTTTTTTAEDKTKFSGTSETNTETYDANNKLVSGTHSSQKHALGKENQRFHETYDPSTGKWEPDVWDGATQKWTSKHVKKEPAPEPKPSPSPTVETGVPPLDQSHDLTQVTPDANAQAALAQGVMLPPTADAGSEIVLNFTGAQQPEGGAGGLVLISEDQQGHKKFFSGKSNAGRLVISAALAEGALKAIEVVKGWDAHGDPLISSRCDIGNPVHLPGTQALASVASGQPALVEAASSAQPGDTMLLHVRGNRPVETRFTLDGQPVKALGISDNSAVLQFDQTTSLAHHELAMQSGNRSSRPVTVAFVQLTPHPIPVAHPGTVETITIDVAGLTAADVATMYFQLVGDAANMVGGGTAAAVPVAGGKAEVRIVGKHAGGVGLRYHLVVKNAQFVDPDSV